MNNKGDKMILYAIIFLLLLPFLVLSIQLIFDKIKYDKTEYSKQTHASFLSVRFDKGKYGEYLTYNELKKIDGYKKFLFNCFIPKDDNKTTEIDLIMIHNTGLYIFESKNYSGWIFGSEFKKNWTQTLPNGGKVQKEYFFNPIIQNKGHIKWITKYLSNETNLIYHSIIVFSNRCTLKKIDLKTKESIVIKREDVITTIKKIINDSPNILSNNTIDQLYQKLFPLTQKTEIEKLQHIENIKNNYNIL